MSKQLPQLECGHTCDPREVKIRYDKAWCPDCAELLGQCARAAAEAQEGAA